MTSRNVDGERLGEPLGDRASDHREANNSSDLPGRLNSAEAERDEALRRHREMALEMTGVRSSWRAEQKARQSAQAEVLALRAEVEEARKVIERIDEVAERRASAGYNEAGRLKHIAEITAAFLPNPTEATDER